MSIEVINRKKPKNYVEGLTDGELQRYQHTLETMDTVGGRLFRALVANKGEWVGTPVLGKTGRTRAMGSNIGRLREVGCTIENKLTYPNCTTSSEVHVFYRLTHEPIDNLRERQAKAKLL